MQTVPRLPEFADKSPTGIDRWFAEMADSGLLFHPDDDPDEIFVIATDEKTFNPDEVVALRTTLDEMFSIAGDDPDIVYSPCVKHARRVMGWIDED